MKYDVQGGCASRILHVPMGGVKHNVLMDAVTIFLCFSRIFFLLFRGHFLQPAARESGLGHTYPSKVWLTGMRVLSLWCDISAPISSEQCCLEAAPHAKPGNLGFAPRRG